MLSVCISSFMIILVILSSSFEVFVFAKTISSKKTNEIQNESIDEVLFTSRNELNEKIKILEERRKKNLNQDSTEELKKLKNEELELRADFYRAVLNHGEDSTQKANTLHALGRNIYKQSKFDDVEAIAKEIVRIHEVVDGVEHLNTAKALGNLGAVTYRINKIKESELAMQRVLYIYRQEFGEASKEVLLHRGKMLTFKIKNGNESPGLTYKEYQEILEENENVHEL